jgi:hypothetical protein
MGTVLVGVEKIAHLLVRCAAYEELYLTPVPKMTTHTNFEEKMTELYTAVLEFLARAKRYFENGPAGKLIFTNSILLRMKLTDSTTAGFLSGTLDAAGKKTLFNTIEDKELSLAREIVIAEAECESYNIIRIYEHLTRGLADRRRDHSDLRGTFQQNVNIIR